MMDTNVPTGASWIGVQRPSRDRFAQEGNSLNLLEVVVAMVLFAGMGTTAISSWTLSAQATHWALEDVELGTVLDREAEGWIAGHPPDATLSTPDFHYTVTDSEVGSVKEIEVQDGNVMGSVDVVETLQ